MGRDDRYDFRTRRLGNNGTNLGRAINRENDTTYPKENNQQTVSTPLGRPSALRRNRYRRRRVGFGISQALDGCHWMGSTILTRFGKPIASLSQIFGVSREPGRLLAKGHQSIGRLCMTYPARWKANFVCFCVFRYVVFMLPFKFSCVLCYVVRFPVSLKEELSVPLRSRRASMNSRKQE